MVVIFLNVIQSSQGNFEGFKIHEIIETFNSFIGILARESTCRLF